MKPLDNDEPARVRQEAAEAVLMAERELRGARVALIACLVAVGAVAVLIAVAVLR